MAKRCDLCGTVLDEGDDAWERAGRETEICRDCLHGGYGMLGRILRRVKQAGNRVGGEE